MSRSIYSLTLGLLVLLTSSLSLGHSLGESYGRLQLTDRGVSISYNMRADQFFQMADPRFFESASLQVAFSEEITNHYKLFSNGTTCEPGQVSVTRNQTFLRATLTYECDAYEGLSLENDAFFEALPDHLHFVQLSGADGAFLGETVIDRVNRSWELPLEVEYSFLDVIKRYAWIGIEHILFGFDHLAFLASVLLVVQGLRGLVLAITGFTLGHSLTLALAVLGIAIPDSRMVEALIGLTIALVAAEFVMTKANRLGLYAIASFILCAASALGLSLAGYPVSNAITLIGVGLFFSTYLLILKKDSTLTSMMVPSLTLLFGMIHGFGFAGSLGEIGLPTDLFLTALLVFNLGIELGQLAIVVVTVASLLLLQKLLPARLTEWTYWKPLTASYLTALGLFWFVARAWS